MSPLRQRRRAEALQRALERYERALASGVDAEQARREIASALGADGRVFAMAASFPDATAPMPEPRSVEAFAARLRTAEVVSRRRAVVARPRFSFAPLAMAAAVVFVAAILVPSFRSLPGDPLYAVKSASEDARVWAASGPAEARVRLDLADERFAEVERLVSRAQLQAMGGPGIIAAGLEDIKDPELTRLIEQTLAEASHQIETAANILIAHPGASDDLDDLVKISQRGRQLASAVAEDLPHLAQSPVLKSAVKFAKIEAKAKAARDKVATPTPRPCATPTPTPTPTPTLDPTATATPTAVPTDTPEPTQTPVPTPCVSPSPTPTPTPTPTATPTATPPSDEVSPSPTEEPQGNDESARGVDQAGDGQDAGMTGSSDDASASDSQSV